MGDGTKMEAGFAGDMLKARVSSHLGTLTLDNPRRKNAVTLAMWRALPEAMRWLAEDAAARVIVIRGAGEQDFSAGADISEFAEVRRDAETARIYEAENSAAFAAIRQAPVPVIAMIRGICYGGGFGLAAAADLRLADSTARFCIPPAKLGLAYPADAVQDIVTALGNQIARFALFTGEVLLPERLAMSGFLLECLPPEKLESACCALATTIAGNAPLSLRASKLAIRGSVENSLQALEQATAIGAATFDSTDYEEGRKAFAEKRKPSFTGR